jgi:cytochrome c oxidase cbb3-type subunit 4
MYTILRELADSWFMLMMFSFFIGVIIFAFRPGTKASYDHLRNLPLQDDDVLVEDKSGEK